MAKKVTKNSVSEPPRNRNRLAKEPQRMVKVIVFNLETVKQPDPEITRLFKRLSESGYKIHVVSDKFGWADVKNMLFSAKLIEHVDYFISCDDIKNLQPSPEVFMRCFQHANISPDEALVCECSKDGLKSASKSMAHLLVVNGKSDISYDKIVKKIESIVFKMVDIIPQVKMNIVMPLLDIAFFLQDKKLLLRVIENIGIHARYVFVVKKQDYEKYYLELLLNAIVANCVIVVSDYEKDYVRSILKAREEINSDIGLVIVDPYCCVDWNPYDFLHTALANDVDSCILTFKSQDSKNMYVRSQEDFVDLVLERELISDNAYAGICYWSKGEDFVNYSENRLGATMASVFNDAISDGKKIKIQGCSMCQNISNL